MSLCLCGVFALSGKDWQRPSAVGAISRIFGFLILAIAVQLVWDGVAEFK